MYAVRVAPLSTIRIAAGTGRLSGSDTVTDTVAPVSAAVSTSRNPGPPSLNGCRVRASSGALRRQPSAIASAAWAALRVPVKQSGAMRTRTCPCCQTVTSRRRGWVMVEANDQAGASGVDATVDGKCPAACIGKGTRDLRGGLSGERRDDAVAVDDLLAAELVEDPDGHALTIKVRERISGRKPDPTLPPLTEVVAGKHLAHRIVDPLDAVAPPEVLRGVGVHQQVATCQDDGVQPAQPGNVLVGEAFLIANPSSIEGPAASEASVAAEE